MRGRRRGRGRRRRRGRRKGVTEGTDLRGGRERREREITLM